MKLDADKEAVVARMAQRAKTFTWWAGDAAEGDELGRAGVDFDRAAKLALVALAHIEMCKLLREVYE